MTTTNQDHANAVYDALDALRGALCDAREAGLTIVLNMGHQRFFTDTVRFSDFPVAVHREMPWGDPKKGKDDDQS